MGQSACIFFLKPMCARLQRGIVPAALLWLAWAVPAGAQSAGTIRGIVKDQSGGVVAGAKITVSNPLHRDDHTTLSKDDGLFVLFGIAFNVYTLTAEKAGFATFRKSIELRSQVPLEVEILLEVGTVQQAVEVVEQLTEVSSTSTHTDIHHDQLQRQPGAAPSRQLEGLLLATPGMVQDDNGRMHARGGHYQTSFLIDGLPVSDQLSIVFSNPFDARNIETMEVYTGNFPPEFGNKLSAVVNVSTKSGIGSKKRAFGGVSLSGGSYDAGEISADIGGGSDRWGYFFSAAGSRTQRHLDVPDQRNFHNAGNGQSWFGRLDFFPNSRNIIRMSMNGARSRFEIPNLASQQLNGQDQSQRLTDYAVRVSWIHTFAPDWSLELTPYYRLAISQLYPSPGDTPVTAGQARRITNTGARAAVAFEGKGHRFKAGLDFFAFPIAENFEFGITGAAFNDPLDPEFNSNLLPHDLTRAGALFRFAGSRTGQEYSFFVQDTYTFKRLTIAGGVRVDVYGFVVAATHASPRVGLAYSTPNGGPVLRLSYNRLFQTPSNENLLLSSSVQAAALVSPARLAIIGTPLVLVRPERTNYFEAGAQQAVGQWLRMDASYYRKKIRDYHDNDQFLNTTVVFPVAISKGDIEGFDFRADVPPHLGLSGYFNFTASRALATPPLSAGLFIGEEAVELFDQSTQFRIDHDQSFSAQWAAMYEHSRSGVWTSVLGRYDSGLPAEIEDPAAVAADPDSAAGLPLVNLDQVPARVRPRLVWNWSLGKEFFKDHRGRIVMQFDILNLTNQKRLYNFLSVFSGTHYIPPRTYAGRIKFHY